MKEIKFHGNLTKEKFWLDWFGLYGRELGTKGNKTIPSNIPTRKWTDNPNDLIEHAKKCAEEHEPNEFCRAYFISSQPMRNTGIKRRDGTFKGEACAIEKLFFDFDDDTKYCASCDKYIKKETFRPVKGHKGSFCPKCDMECVEKPRLDVVGKEVKKFVNNLDRDALIVQTRKGYHVYLFLIQVLPFSRNKFEFAKKVYKELQKMFITDDYEFLDKAVIGDIMRFSRLPLTMHEKSGEICYIVDKNLKPTKVRSLDLFRTYGISPSMVRTAIDRIEAEEQNKVDERKQMLEEMANKLNGNSKYSKGIIRPCFQIRMDLGEMSHPQRLAWLLEIYHSGHNTPEKMLELCRCFDDFSETKSKRQINDFFKHERQRYNPYRCTTIKQKGWCIEKECFMWKGSN